MPSVRSYTRPSDEVHVRGHWRNPPSASAAGSGIAGFLVFIAGLAVIGQGLDGHISGRYRPFQSGYHVVDVGPYPSTAAGRATAARVASTLSGSLVRDVRTR